MNDSTERGFALLEMVCVPAIIALAAVLTPVIPHETSSAAAPKSARFRVLTEIGFNDGRRTSSDVVIALGGNEDPYRVLSWRDDVASGTGSRKRTGL
jgi:prepilin-type N-terminal cleavage/methylation domain-containing protein